MNEAWNTLSFEMDANTIKEHIIFILFHTKGLNMVQKLYE